MKEIEQREEDDDKCESAQDRKAPIFLAFYCDYCNRRIDNLTENRFSCQTCDINQIGSDCCESCWPIHSSTHSGHLVTHLRPSCPRPLSLWQSSASLTLRNRLLVHRERSLVKFLDGRPPFTYEHAYCQSRSLATSIRRRVGIQPGSSIVLIGENSPEWIVSDFACIFGGFVAVPLPVTLDATSLSNHISRASASLAICSESQSKKTTSIKTIVFGTPEWIEMTSIQRNQWEEISTTTGKPEFQSVCNSHQGRREHSKQ